jgi:hypothetical protein
LRKLAIHFGTQLAHPAVVCNDWLIEWPPGRIAGYDDEDTVGLDERCDLPFRLRVAMLGSFGISASIDRWPEADLVVAAEHVVLYRSKLRLLIHHGDQYFLTPPPVMDGGDGWAAIWYAAKDRSGGVLLAFRLGSNDASHIFPLAGLTPEQSYRASLLSAGSVLDTAGEELGRGIEIIVPGSFQSELVLVEAR